MLGKLHIADLLKQNIIWVVIISTFFLCLLFIHLRLNQYALDDAYIHFRIVENWINDGLPYFNINEPVKASSSSAWIATLFILQQIFHSVGKQVDMLFIVAILNSLSLTAGMTIFYLLYLRVSKSKPRNLYQIAFSLIFISLTINSSLGLMETPTTIAIVGIAFLLLFSGKKFSFTLFGLAIFFRLEMGLLFLIIVLYSLYSKRFNIKDIVIYSSLGIIPFLIFDYYFYGTLIPNTIHAKSTIYSLTLVDQIAIIFSRIGNSYRLLPRYDNLSNLYLFILIFFPLIILSVYGFQLIRARRNILGIEGLLYLFWGLGIISMYLISGVLIFIWYEPLFMIPLFIVIFSFLTIKIEEKYSYIAKSILVTLVLIQSIALIQVLSAALINPAYLPGFPEGARARQYISIGKSLYQDYPNARLMTSEIGGLGYGFRGYILDSAGLVSPQVLDYPGINKSGGKIITEFIKDAKPEIIVSYDIFIDEDFVEESSGDYTIQFVPVFSKEDMDWSIITTPWGDSYQRVPWWAEDLLVLVSRDIY